MNNKFIVNDYLLIWNILFRSSISEEIYKLKQKVWNTYKEEYNLTFKDRDKITNDYKNFIPNNDIIYNILLENKEYEKLKKQCEKYRLEVVKIWDKYQKDTDYLVNKIVRLDIKDLITFTINPDFNIIESEKNKFLTVGLPIDKKNNVQILFDIIKTLLEYNIKEYKDEYKPFKDVIIEFTLNEFQTMIMKKSCYDNGKVSLRMLKRCLYPYWLMYLGVPKNEFLNYMKRDKIFFDVKNYAYETELKKMNIEEFINFCIRNQKYIIRKKEKIDEEII